MKKVLICLLVLIPLFSLTACTNSTPEELAVVKVESNNIKNELLEETLIEIEDEGIYGLNTSGRSYLIFNGVTSNYEDVELALKDEILQILFNKVTSDAASKTVYELIPYPSEKYDTIQLIENGEETAFEQMIIGGS